MSRTTPGKTVSHVTLLLALIFGGLSGCGEPGAMSTPQDHDTEEVADTMMMLLDTDQLHALSNDEQGQKSGDVRILDVRSESDYAAGHVPGALWANASSISRLAKQPGGMHDAKAWSDAISPLGITRDTRVVVYGAQRSVSSTTRIWWLLKYVGVKNAAILDGGWQAWADSDNEQSATAAQYEPSEFAPEFQKDRLIEVAELKDRLNAQGVHLLDTRTENEYTGAQARGARGGRIPGATHLNWTELVDENFRFKSKDDLKALFESRGALPDQECITYCQSGGRASAEAFALELLGYKNVRTYYASWQEWSAAQDLPIETGDGG
ncbi:MAG: sulfurtransferase [Pirellulales bacterium]|nr:sulfurtransferase [Pirellulales bacterium]